MAENSEPPSKRTLEKDIPELKGYLSPGIKVLDIGCGPGTITMDVAAAVSPGEVIGIDPVEDRLAKAKDWESKVSTAGNISFKTGDCHRLDFPEDAFDLVYSHTVAHFFLDPVEALKEQKRVVKPGGWVIASGVRDPAVLTRYPPCPNWDKAWKALGLYHDGVQERYRSSGENPVEFLARETKQNPSYLVYFDMQAGRKCPGWFRQAGLSNLRITIKGSTIAFQGSDNLKPGTFDMLANEESDTNSANQKSINLAYQRMIDQGLIGQETLDRANEEARSWYSDPSAFNYWVLIFVAGQV